MEITLDKISLKEIGEASLPYTSHLDIAQTASFLGNGRTSQQRHALVREAIKIRAKPYKPEDPISAADRAFINKARQAIRAATVRQMSEERLRYLKERLLDLRAKVTLAEEADSQTLWNEAYCAWSVVDSALQGDKFSEEMRPLWE